MIFGVEFRFSNHAFHSIFDGFLLFLAVLTEEMTESRLLYPLWRWLRILEFAIIFLLFTCLFLLLGFILDFPVFLVLEMVLLPFTPWSIPFTPWTTEEIAESRVVYPRWRFRTLVLVLLNFLVSILLLDLFIVLVVVVVGLTCVTPTKRLYTTLESVGG